MEDKTLPTTPPPPPSEVKIRTMRSDIESMMQSGGGAPSFRDVAVQGLSLEKNYKPPTKFVMTAMPVAAPVQKAPPAAPAPTPTASAPAATPVIAPVEPPAQTSVSMPAQADIPAITSDVEALPKEVTDESPKSSFVPVLIVTLVAILAIAVVGYFAYALFIK